MIVIYTSPSCSSCRKAKKWFDEHNIKYREKNIINTKLLKDDIYLMLKNSENGFDDIVSTRSKIFENKSINFQDMKFQELMDFIIENPTLLRRPIIVDDRIMQVGYNNDEIRAFIPKQYRDMFNCNNCTGDICCDYQKAIRESVSNLKDELV